MTQQPRKRRRLILRLAALFVLVVLVPGGIWFAMIRMPGSSHTGPLPPLTEAEGALAQELERDVVMLATEIGDRNVVRHAEYAVAARWIEVELRKAGYAVTRQEFDVEGVTCANIEATQAGTTRADEIVVVGAHYDSASGFPGANDNGTGVAATLALARRVVGSKTPRTLRFVAFANEEPPYFQRETMGSLVYARRCAERGDDVVAMLSLETMGCYSDEEGSQHYPVRGLGLAYPTTGNFIAIVGNTDSRRLVREVVGSFRRQARFPSEGAALPGGIPGVGWSDHWAFWQADYPAVMVTDTAPFRYAHYHTIEDTPDKVDFERTARVVSGLERVLGELLAPAE